MKGQLCYDQRGLFEGIVQSIGIKVKSKGVEYAEVCMVDGKLIVKQVYIKGGRSDAGDRIRVNLNK